ncbi:MAG: hypothetical protein ACRDRL_06130, partial [Sciscionella sp.]
VPPEVVVDEPDVDDEWDEECEWLGEARLWEVGALSVAGFAALPAAACRCAARTSSTSISILRSKDQE